MLSVKGSVSDISLDKKSLYELSRFIHNWNSRKESPERSERSNVSSEQITQMVLTLTPTVYTTGFGEGLN